MKKIFLTTALFLCSAQQAEAVPACDDRIDINNPARFPFNTIATVRFDSDCAADYKSWGTGTLVGPHMLLTAGHVVYNRNAGMKNQTCNYIQPGAYHDASTGDIVHPYGERTISDTKYKKTNNKWADQSYTPKRGVDYGAIRIVCPFEDINTYMPMVFDLNPTFINTSGYAVEDLPSTGNVGDQWRGAGSVTSQADRTITYDQRSTGGASGAPVWLYNASAGTRRITAVNTAHSTQCNGIGTSLVWQNEDLLNDWLDWEPTLLEKLNEGCATLIPIEYFSVEDLVKGFNKASFKRYSKNELNLIEVPKSSTGLPSNRIYQFIQNHKFVWEEYKTLQNKRFIKLLEPEEKWLSIAEAQALLSASESWTDQAPSGLYETRAPIGQSWNSDTHTLPFDDANETSKYLKNDDTIDVDYDLE
ncbi:trypsin-like serine peptidase [Marinicella sp. W31]|uniref:trypsin-like serine peptidase n=1 Tax=Marinicella sp. W31 TaxID=3023713 RepID=UPI0037571DE6